MAALLGSSPLLLQSWSLCAAANATVPESFMAEVIGDVAYVAFSGVQILPRCGGGRELVTLDAGGVEELFWPLNRHREELREPAMADSGILKIFVHIYTHHNLLEKVSFQLSSHFSLFTFSTTFNYVKINQNILKYSKPFLLYLLVFIIS